MCLPLGHHQWDFVLLRIIDDGCEAPTPLFNLSHLIEPYFLRTRRLQNSRHSPVENMLIEEKTALGNRTLEIRRDLILRQVLQSAEHTALTRNDIYEGISDQFIFYPILARPEADALRMGMKETKQTSGLACSLLAFDHRDKTVMDNLYTMIFC